MHRLTKLPLTILALLYGVVVNPDKDAPLRYENVTVAAASSSSLSSSKQEPTSTTPTITTPFLAVQPSKEHLIQTTTLPNIIVSVSPDRLPSISTSSIGDPPLSQFSAASSSIPTPTQQPSTVQTPQTSLTSATYMTAQEPQTDLLPQTTSIVVLESPSTSQETPGTTHAQQPETTLLPQKSGNTAPESPSTSQVLESSMTAQQPETTLLPPRSSNIVPTSPSTSVLITSSITAQQPHPSLLPGPSTTVAEVHTPSPPSTSAQTTLSEALTTQEAGSELLPSPTTGSSSQASIVLTIQAPAAALEPSTTPIPHFTTIQPPKSEFNTPPAVVTSQHESLPPTSFSIAIQTSAPALLSTIEVVTSSFQIQTPDSALTSPAQESTTTITLQIPGSALVTPTLNSSIAVQVPGTALTTPSPGQAQSTVPQVEVAPTSTTGIGAIIFSLGGFGPSLTPIPVTTAPSVTATPPVIIIGSSTFTQDSASQFVVGTATLTPNGEVTISTSGGSEGSKGLATVSLGASGSNVVVNGVTSAIVPAQTTAPVYFGTSAISQDAHSHYIFGSQTLSPGSVITVSGQTISLSPDNVIILNGATATTSSPSTSQPPAVIVFGSLTITANSASNFVIGSQTLTPGSAITVSNQVITLPVTSSTKPTAGSSPTQIIVLDSSTISENSASQFVVGSQTLSAGGVITVDSQTISLSPSGTAIVVNGKTSSIGTAPTTLSTSSTSLSSLLIAGQTLTSGGTITVGSEILSFASSGTGVVVVGTATTAGGTATETAAEKSAGEKGSRSSLGFLCLQFSLVVGAFLVF